MAGKPNILTSFIRYNMVAIIATSVDFISFILLKDVFGLWYVLSGFLSAVSGGITAFILNRNWVFYARSNGVVIQLVRYILVWGGSIFLNTYGLYLLVEYTTLNPLPAKVIVAVLVGVFYNFLMSKYFIFKE